MGKFLLILLMLASANSFAEVNKWIDDQGRVHYSDQPPPLMCRPRFWVRDLMEAQAV